ncbi:tubulin monoglutamylase TTLL4-like isoform X3 [Metopolophium dirhodum]|uniref:tubulin monoglutamylase TTLL4-like isoform X3 n=1 Tax=Metopolophium dirhodum TaxID=44670 RepID=UPI0029902C96|nr:tubulin monoglutamylase TTLL4-like isoform X3 [Metopolophium dirhodum]
MNNKSYSILTKETVNNSEDDETEPEIFFCPACNVHMNKIYQFRPLLYHFIHQQHKSFSSDGIEEWWSPMDQLQILRTNLHRVKDHSSEIFLKLNPYLILDTDPTLDNLNYLNTLSRSPHSLDVIKEQWYPIDRLQTFRTNLYQTMDHSSERLLKLSPYPILSTDPTLDNLNYSNTSSTPLNSLGNKKKDNTTQSIHEIEQNDRRNDIFQYHSNSRQWGEKENDVHQEELKIIDQFNYTSIKNNNMHIRQSPVHCQRKILPTVLPKHLISINCMKNIGCSSLTAHNHLNNNSNLKNKDLINIPNQKTLVNHVRLDTLLPIESKETFKSIKNIEDTPKVNESLLITKEDKTIPIPELILNSEKSKSKLSDKNNKTLTSKTKRRTDNINNTSMFPANSLKTHIDFTSENARKILQSTIVKTLNKSIQQDFMTDEQNKLALDNLLSGTQKQTDHFEYHSALRPSLFSNMPPYIRFSSHNIKSETFPLPLQKLLKWKLSSITPIVVRQTIQNSGFKLVKKSNDWIGTWGKHMKSLCFKTLWQQQKLNHFPGTFQIGRKDRLWKNLNRLMMKYGNEHFGFIPKSYILPQEAKILRQVWEKNDEDKWIVKPPASARGTGIRVISKWDQIPKKIPLVVQRYIDNPYLINDTKFDLRLYILITSINPLRIYFYDNGLVRFASVKYSSDLTTICDRYMHLTNYSINRLSSQFTENEDADACQGHKWSLRSLWTYMEKERKIDVKKLWASLEDLVVKTLISGESPISEMCSTNLGNRYNAYELFGIDVLFDEYLKPWILEVNISPSLHSSSPLDLAVKGPLVKDLMNMVGYHIPNKMSRSTHNTLLKMLGVKSPLCYDKRLYTFNLSAKEKEKQEYYTNVESRIEYIDSILNDLLPDDIRHLIVYEDELTQVGSFKKVFPTTTSFKYHQYFDGSRYYNMLFDAWECKYSNNRREGITVLEKLCQLKFHLEVPDIDEEQSKVTY